MANYLTITALFKQKEGGMSRASTDKASANPAPCTFTVNGKTASDWHTNKGVTWPTFKAGAAKVGYNPTCENFFKMPDKIWLAIMKQQFWDVWGLDELRYEALAWTILWWSWGSGVGGATNSFKSFLQNNGVNASSKKDIVAALSDMAQKRGERKLFKELTDHRLAFYATRDTAKDNLSGWTAGYNKFVDFVETNYFSKTVGAPSASGGPKNIGVAFFVLIGIGLIVYSLYHTAT